MGLSPGSPRSARVGLNAKRPAVGPSVLLLHIEAPQSERS
jgi:hypothetical protein